MPSAALCVIFISLIALASAQDDVCLSSEPVTVPPDFEPIPATEFPFIEAGLQIFTNLTVPCTGSLVEWRFLSRNNLVLGLHLAVFRRSGNSRFQLVGQNYIESLYINRTSRWQRYLLDEPIPVMGGDVIGMFYDSFFTLQDMLAIPSRGNRNNYERKLEKNAVPPSIVLALDNTHLSRNSEFSVIGAPRDFRVPALTAVISTTPLVIGEPKHTLVASDTEAPRTTTQAIQVEPFTIGQLTAAPIEDDLSFQENPAPTPRPQQYFSRRCFNPPTALQQCTSMSMRAYFDYHNGACKPFFGCDSPVEQPNNFASGEECNKLCAPMVPYIADMHTLPDTTTTQAPPPPPPPPARQLPPVFQQSKMTPSYCFDSPSSLVSCSNIGPRYYYDASVQQCYSFYGCSLGKRIGNNFNTVEECQKICRVSNPISYWVQPPPPPAVQTLPPPVAAPTTLPPPPRVPLGRYDRGMLDPFAVFLPSFSRLGTASRTFPANDQQRRPQPLQQRQSYQQNYDPINNLRRDSYVSLDDNVNAGNNGGGYLDLDSDNSAFFKLANFFVPGIPRPVLPYNQQQQQPFLDEGKDQIEESSSSSQEQLQEVDEPLNEESRHQNLMDVLHEEDVRQPKRRLI